jgi:ABC-type sugar transport system substrate-binding protein
MGAKECEVLKIAALVIATSAASIAAGSIAAAATTSSETMLVSNAPWWEKVTVTMAGNGNAQSCSYQTSLKPGASEHCDVSSEAAAMSKASDNDGGVTSITFERRFSPGAEPAKPQVGAGDTLLGGQIMALNIDRMGKVKGCKVVAQSGDLRPDYSCDDAAAERFQASLGASPHPERQGYMTVIVYGHSEHMV